ncbi:hypothetical protein LZG00_19035 [Rhodobacteraceae bacterium LMO-12]|nr:hypothetical protein [Rhodobacteraceae bacterium LMO-JJ12]
MGEIFHSIHLMLRLWKINAAGGFMFHRREGAGGQKIPLAEVMEIDNIAAEGTIAFDLWRRDAALGVFRK